MPAPTLPPRRGREPKTPRQTNVTGAQSDEQAPTAHPDRPTSTEPLNRRTLNLAESHAHEADRLAHTPAGITHALLAHFWLNNAQEQPR